MFCYQEKEIPLKAIHFCTYCLVLSQNYVYTLFISFAVYIKCIYLSMAKKKKGVINGKPKHKFCIFFQSIRQNLQESFLPHNYYVVAIFAVVLFCNK